MCSVTTPAPREDKTKRNSFKKKIKKIAVLVYYYYDFFDSSLVYYIEKYLFIISYKKNLLPIWNLNFMYIESAFNLPILKLCDLN